MVRFQGAACLIKGSKWVLGAGAGQGRPVPPGGDLRGGSAEPRGDPGV